LSLPRIFHPGPASGETTVRIEGETLHYLKSVLRIRPGREIGLFDGRGGEWRAVVEAYGPGEASLRILKKEDPVPSPGGITLAQSLPKTDKMDFIVRKATELGAARILPFLSSRSIPRPDAGKRENRLARWRRIAVEAARQCGRSVVPEVGEILSYEEMLGARGAEDLGIVLWEEERERSLKTLLRGGQAEGRTRFFVVVGPEGGFSADEIDRAAAAGFVPVTLGPNILRTETAPLAVLSILQYEMDFFSERATHE